MLKWTLAAVALLAAAPAAARDWYLISTAASGSSAVFIDKDAIADSAGGFIRSEVFTVRAADDDKGNAAYAYSLEFDCAQHQYRFLHITVMNAAGKTVGDQPGSGKWRPYAAGEQTDAMATYACSRGAAPADAQRYGADYPLARAREMLATKTPPPAQ